MKAIRIHRFGGPEVLQYEEASSPKPGPGEILVRIKAAGVNPVETYIRAGLYGEREFPFTPGSDGAGVIEAAGENVKKYKIGDRVYCAGSVTGTYAEQTVCRATQIFPLPAKLSFEEGAALHVPCATAFRALFMIGKAEPGESVLVHGASGGVGTAAVQIARAHGLTVIATAGTDRGLELVKNLGAHHVLNHRDPLYWNSLSGITGGKGVNLILEMLANVNLGNDLKALALGGRVVVIGSRGPVQIDPRDTMSREAKILGMRLFNAGEEELQKIHASLGALLESGQLKPVIGKKLPLREASSAHELIMQPGSYGKIVLIP